MTFVIVQTAFLGDVVLSLPMCAALRSAHPNAEIIFVTTPVAAPIVQLCSDVSCVVVFDKRGEHKSWNAAKRLAASISNDADTTVVVPHRSFRTAWFVRHIKSSRVIAYAEGYPRFVANARVSYNRQLHDADRQLKLLASTVPPIVCSKSDAQCKVNFNNEQLRSLLPNSLGSANQQPYVVLAPGSAWPTKKWGSKKYFHVASELAASGRRVVMVGPEDDAGIEQSDLILDLCGKTTLQQLVSVIAHSVGLVANDSAPVHIASVLNIPTIAIFGPTIPQFGFAPFAKNSMVLENNGLNCRPCSMHGAASCPIKTHECMTSIQTHQVVNGICDIFV